MAERGVEDDGVAALLDALRDGEADDAAGVAADETKNAAGRAAGGRAIERSVTLARDAGAPLRVSLSAVSVAGDARQPNEDAFATVAFDDALLLGVFDGTTSLRETPALRGRGVSGAWLAARIARDALRRARPADEPDALLFAANARLRDASVLLGVADLDAGALPATSATIARLDARAGSIRLAHVYDSWCVAFLRDGSSALLTEDRNRAFDQPVLELMARLARERGRPPRELRDDPAVRDALLAARMSKSNRPDGAGVGVANGDPAMAPYVQRRTLALDAVALLVLGTDGLLPQGWAMERPADRERLRETIERGGLTALLDLKRASEDADPDWRQVRFKHSDDATGIVARIEPAGRRGPDATSG